MATNTKAPTKAEIENELKNVKNSLKKNEEALKEKENVLHLPIFPKSKYSTPTIWHSGDINWIMCNVDALDFRHCFIVVLYYNLWLLIHLLLELLNQLHSIL